MWASTAAKTSITLSVTIITLPAGQRFSEKWEQMKAKQHRLNTVNVRIIENIRKALPDHVNAHPFCSWNASPQQQRVQQFYSSAAAGGAPAAPFPEHQSTHWGALFSSSSPQWLLLYIPVLSQQVLFFKWKEDRFRLDVRNKFFTQAVVRHWHRLPTEAVDAPSV